MALDTATRAHIRRLFRDGRDQAEICGTLGLHIRDVKEVLHDAGLSYTISPNNPCTGYQLPYVDERELTDRQKEERAASLAKIFEAQVEREMSAPAAKKYLACTASAIAREKNVTLNQAKHIQARARAFLDRFATERALS